MTASTIAHDLQPLLDRLSTFKSPPLETLSPANARNAPTLNNAVAEQNAENLSIRAVGLFKPMPEPVGSVTHCLIPTRSGELLARVFTPKGSGPFPTLLYFHGGGFVIGNLDTYEPSCRALCNQAEAMVVSVAYRQAPEFPFPAAVEDADDALQWLLAHADALNGDRTRVAVVGESAGGNLAAVACLRALSAGKALPVAQVLVYPVVDWTLNSPSYQEHAQAVPLNAAMMAWFRQHYLPDRMGAETLASADASPLRATQVAGLPPTMVITAEFDPLRDDGRAYAERLRSDGVNVEYRHYDGVTHEFFGLSGLVSQAKDAVKASCDFLKHQFDIREHTLQAETERRVA